ncbi:HYC_CC_PP family protein [Zobellia roscoffensis]|uniref:HYC_CC_PP family protein n=1 Tax=Zobellia roscoffensis TaxID=2779508 RepID=UPI00188A6F45|nr:hypothetical protein [Zobellia roscoffensis]
MKEKLHRFFACLMTVALLFSTTSFKVEKHYCMGHLVDVAFFSDVQDCGMEMVSDEAASILDEESCCDEEMLTAQGVNDVKPSFNEFHIEHQQFLIAYTYSYLGLFEPQINQNISHRYYLPPDIVKDIQLLDDVFLI